MSPGDPPRICARSAASSPAASTCDDFEAWASSTNLSGMEEIGLRLSGASADWRRAFSNQPLSKTTAKNLVVQTTRSCSRAEGSQSFPLPGASLFLLAANSISVRCGPGAHRTRWVADVRDLDFCLTIVGLNVDGGHVLAVLRNDLATILIE